MNKFSSPFMAKSPLLKEKLTSKEKKAARLVGKEQRVRNKARKIDAKNQPPTPTKPLQEGVDYLATAEGTTKKSSRKIKRADKIKKKRDKAVEKAGDFNSKSDAVKMKMVKKKFKAANRR